MSETIFSDANFEAEVIKSELPVVVDFFASWCGPCRLQAPIIDELSEELKGRAKVGKIDADANPATAQKYEVMSLPTIIIFKAGQEGVRFVGLQNKETILGEINGLV